MIVFPAIDLLDGQCVRLTRGERDKATVYSADPAAVARRWKAAGAEWLHVVDLNGALEGRCFVNLDSIRAIVDAVDLPVQIGGGIRSTGDIENYLAAGVKRVIVGTKALESDEFRARVIKDFGPRVALSLDTKNGRVAVKGWTETGDLSIVDAAVMAAREGAALIIVTDVMRDGMLTTPNFDLYKQLADASDVPTIASGGVATIGDITRLREMALPNLVGVITGKALYEGTLDLAAAIAAAKSRR